MEWLIGGVVVWFIYRILTVGSRRNKYFMEAILQAYEKKGLYATYLTWSDAVGLAERYYNFSKQHHHDDLNYGEARFDAVLNGNDVEIRIIRDRDGNAQFMVSDAQEVNDIHQKMRSGDFDPKKYFNL